MQAALTKSEQREVQIVVNHARTNPHFAAAIPGVRSIQVDEPTLNKR